MKLVSDLIYLITCFFFFETRILVYKLYTVLLLNLLRPHYNFIYLWQKLTIKLRGSTLEIIFRKSHVIIYITSSVDPIYQGVSENESFQTIYHIIKFGGSLCPDVHCLSIGL